VLDVLDVVDVVGTVVDVLLVLDEVVLVVGAGSLEEEDVVVVWAAVEVWDEEVEAVVAADSLGVAEVATEALSATTASVAAGVDPTVAAIDWDTMVDVVQCGEIGIEAIQETGGVLGDEDFRFRQQYLHEREVLKKSSESDRMI
jgi:hypothetical protein